MYLFNNVLLVVQSTLTCFEISHKPLFLRQHWPDVLFAGAQCFPHLIAHLAAYFLECIVEASWVTPILI